MAVPPIPALGAVHPHAALALLVVLLRLLPRLLLLEVQSQSIPLNSNRLSLWHTINSQPYWRPWNRALQLGCRDDSCTADTRGGLATKYRCIQWASPTCTRPEEEEELFEETEPAPTGQHQPGNQPRLSHHMRQWNCFPDTRTLSPSSSCAPSSPF
jgi:hypothetical protein